MTRFCLRAGELENSTHSLKLQTEEEQTQKRETECPSDNYNDESTINHPRPSLLEFFIFPVLYELYQQAMRGSPKFCSTTWKHFLDCVDSQILRSVNWAGSVQPSPVQLID